ncbi:hypothetical protein EJC51_15750 [Streptomyces aquilus]|uniref:Uncharacterized protein n=1 Tax=Streptomyces aquilus TaxID=2548456 RepID=A0A3S9HZC7_9ACTN|nr:hypothetical protein [Streptomyces aquilus]AZP17446.1 hypothetical protein EJC51_15750 [Streptomyces aquilus]
MSRGSAPVRRRDAFPPADRTWSRTGPDRATLGIIAGGLGVSLGESVSARSLASSLVAFVRGVIDTLLAVIWLAGGPPVREPGARLTV